MERGSTHSRCDSRTTLNISPISEMESCRGWREQECASPQAFWRPRGSLQWVAIAGDRSLPFGRTQSDPELKLRNIASHRCTGRVRIRRFYRADICMSALDRHGSFRRHRRWTVDWRDNGWHRGLGSPVMGGVAYRLDRTDFLQPDVLLKLWPRLPPLYDTDTGCPGIHTRRSRGD